MNQEVNPSLKNGYLSIANELVEKFAACNIPGNSMRILWCVMRKTWGWSQGARKKDWDQISYTQFEKMTGMNRRNVGRSIKFLVAKRLLLKSVSGYRINQNYNEWLVAKRLLGANVVASRGKCGQKVGVKRLHTKDIKTLNKRKGNFSSSLNNEEQEPEQDRWGKFPSLASAVARKKTMEDKI